MSGPLPETSAITRSPVTWTVADAFLEALANAGIEYIFAVLGSDHPSIIEAYMRRQNANESSKPKLLIFLHEYTAISAADGYARISKKTPCVLVHVDVGTAALAQGLHNSSSGRAPLLIFAGLAPTTLYGEAAGSRSEHVQWYQDCPNQAAMMSPYSRFSGEIKAGMDVAMIVRRAIMMASTGSVGPAYLTSTREVLASDASAQSPEAIGSKKKFAMPSCHIGGLPKSAIEEIAAALIDAEKPLVVTGYIGRNPAAVAQLVKLADTIRGLRVFDFEAREMSFPADHPGFICRSTGAAPAIKTADVILVLDADVPWIPTKVKPSDEAVIFHIDIDPRKEKMNLFDIHAQATYNADCEEALEQLNAHITASPAFSGKSTIFESRWSSLLKSHAAGIETLAQKAAAPPNDKISTTYLFAELRKNTPADTVFLSDVVTNQVPLTEQLQLTRPGTNFTKGGSGLGWSGGAAIGASIALRSVAAAAAEEAKPAPFLTTLTGDGSFIFSAPTGVYAAQRTHKTPFLSIVVNNGGWKATRACLTDVHPQGVAAKASEKELGIGLWDIWDDENDSDDVGGPDYGGIAKAAAGGRLWIKKVAKASELKGALEEAVKKVQGGMGALLDVVISA